MNNDSFIPALVPPYNGGGSGGITFTPSVSEDGVISWTNDGGKENPDPVNIKGPAGEDGADGQTGPQGAPGVGVPTGGMAGQFLKKVSGTDYDTQWADPPEGGGDTTYLVRAPVGTIVIWSGTADNIPTGWRLCDGTNGTPDLRDKFVLGAGTAHSVGETGGEENVTLTVAQMPSHSHAVAGMLEASTKITTSTTGGSKAPYYTSYNTANSGSSQPHPNMPPYYTLCYIMKLTADETDGTDFTPDDTLTLSDGTLGVTSPVQGIYTQEEFNALPEAQRNKGLYVIPEDGDGSGGGSIGEIYSTEEVRIGTWIDGKPLYRMVYTFVNSLNSFELPSPSTFDMDEIIDVSGFVKNQLSTSSSTPSILFIGKPAILDGKTYSASILVKKSLTDAGDLRSVIIKISGVTLGSGTWYYRIIFLYTKTTDVATQEVTT